MNRQIALLRGINVGGKNIIKMATLKDAFEKRGFQGVHTYINSGNVIFESELQEPALKVACEKLISEDFGFDIPVCVISAVELASSLAHAPGWWNQASDARHDAFFVIPPMTTEKICAHVGAIKEEYEKIAYFGRIIFWTAQMATFSRTRWSKISNDRAMYQTITVRNANTTLKLAELSGK